MMILDSGVNVSRGARPVRAVSRPAPVVSRQDGPLDVASLTAAQIRAAVAQGKISKATVLRQELAGKNRASVLAFARAGQ